MFNALEAILIRKKKKKASSDSLLTHNKKASCYNPVEDY